MPTTTTLPVNPSVLSIELDITSEEGARNFGEVAAIEVEKPDMLRFKLIDWNVEGLQSISLGGRVNLVSESASYKIDMPCMLNFNASCARVMLLILGYDALLRIEPGRYSVMLEIYWSNAEGSGESEIIHSHESI